MINLDNLQPHQQIVEIHTSLKSEIYLWVALIMAQFFAGVLITSLSLLRLLRQRGSSDLSTLPKQTDLPLEDL